MPIDDELADSILEEHCSRIWESSAQQTPCRSPGRHSPKSKSPDRLHCKAMAPGVSSIQVPPGSLAKVHSGHKKKDKDLHSMWSCDSGVGEEKSTGGHHSQESTHKLYHHYYHHHHHSSHEGKSRQQIEMEARKYGMMCYMGEPVSRNHPDYHLTAHKESDRGRSHIRKSNVRKHSDASSNIDSGISTIYEKDPLPTIPNLSALTSEKYVTYFSLYVFVCVLVLNFMPHKFYNKACPYFSDHRNISMRTFYSNQKLFFVCIKTGLSHTAFRN